MDLEDALLSVLRAHCPRVFPVTAPFGTSTPYLVFQRIGGRSVRFLNNTAGDKRNVTVQITVWDDDPDTAFRLIHAIEDALCAAAPLLVAEPKAEPMDAFDDTGALYGAQQDFSIWGQRS